MPRLQLRLYLAFLGVLLAVVAVTAAINFLVGRPYFNFMRGGPRMAVHLARMLPPLDRADSLEHALDELHDELGVDISVLRPDGTEAANSGTPIPVPEPASLERARRGPQWLSKGIVGGPLRSPPGALVLARLPVPEGAGQRALLRTVLLLLGTLLVSFALVYPLSRSITRPLEQLTTVVEAYGHGDLARRSGLGGSPDEVGKLARSFDEMADRIQATRRAEKELLANVSHELRTPLARMKVAIELIDAPDEKLQRRLASVSEEVDELDRLIADVLTASRLDLAAQPLRKQALPAREVLEKSRQRALALAPGLQVDLLVDDGLTLQADEALFARALDNLLDNARKYGNGRPVEISARRDGAFVSLAVRDHGTGIPQAELPRIFEPFFRGAGARGQASGWGLGLALARRVAEAHGGTAVAANAEGGGARIELRIPV